MGKFAKFECYLLEYSSLFKPRVVILQSIPSSLVEEFLKAHCFHYKFHTKISQCELKVDVLYLLRHIFNSIQRNRLYYFMSAILLRRKDW